MTTVSYPSGEITRMQFRKVLEGVEPFVAYTSWDGETTFHLMGPLSPVIGVQEGVTITTDSIKGLIPSWQMLDQQGANQDGVTFNDAVYGPAEIDMMVEAHGLTPQSTREVVRTWINAWDAHRPGELTVVTPENGAWWADVRWIQSPGDPLMRGSSNRQKFMWTCRIDDSFWKSWDSVSTFGFSYESLTDTFNRGGSQTTDLGTNWPLVYFGNPNPTGWTGGYLYAAGSQASWRDLQGTGLVNPLISREVVAGPYRNFSTASDYQVVNMVLGSVPEITLLSGAFNDLWARMGRNSNGTWNGYGIRARIGPGTVELRRYMGYNNGVLRTQIMASRYLVLPPVFGEKFTLVAGVDGDLRKFRVLRNGVTILETKEFIPTPALPDNPSAPIYTSAIGSAYRGIGFGMFAAGALVGQATPANVRKISAGDNSTVSQESFMPLTNVGDVEAWPRFLVYGPGRFSFGNGPFSDDLVEFGPLEAGQVVLIETEPRRRSIVDVSPSQLPEQVLNPFQGLIKALVTFASGNNKPPLLAQFESLFGILPPQANLYSLMNGRFTRPLDPRPPGTAGITQQIRVRIDDGDASSKVVAAITPRRKWPL